MAGQILQTGKGETLMMRPKLKGQPKLMMRLILSVLCLFIWFPLLLMAGNSFLSKGEMLSRFGPVLNGGTGSVEVALFPDYPTLSPLVELLLDSPGFFVMFWNSCLQTGAVLCGQMLTAVPAAWAFAMYSFPGKRTLFLGYIILMILPFQVLMTPDYFVLNKLHLLDTHLAVILPGIFSTFPVFIMTQFFTSIPKPLLEAARLDGAGESAVFFLIGLPMGLPGVLAAGILGFLENWNAIEAPMAFLKDRTLWPLALYLPDITADKVSVAWVASAAAMAPPLFLFLAGQSYLEQGIMVSGIKE